MKYRFEVWQQTGFVEIEADDPAEAGEKVKEHGLDSPSDGIVFDPYCDGQEWELRIRRKECP